jgi:hypothetical protein
MSRDHDIDDGRVFDDLADDFCSCLAEPYSQERTDLDYSVLEYSGLGEFVLPLLLLDLLKTHIFFLYFPNCIEGMYCDFPHCVHHILERGNSSKL